MITKIFDYGMNGEGVSKIDGKVVLINNSLIDEDVDIDIIKEYDNYSIGEINYICNASVSRVNPPCPYFETCGGCHIQHMSYDEQLRFKRSLVRKTLKKVANIDVEVKPTVPSDYQYGYRNKISINTNQSKCGFFSESTNDIIDVENCLLASEEISKIYTICRNCVEKLKSSHIRNIVIRSINNQILIGVVCREMIDLKIFVNECMSNSDKIGIYQILNKRNDAVVLSGKVKHLAGIQKIDITDYDLTYSVDLLSFHQTNQNIQNKIYSKVLDYISPDMRVINGFSGQGLLSAIISKKAKHTIGIEINESAHRSAEELKRNNKISNMTNVLGDFNKEILKIDTKNDILVLDPSKKGCGETILSKLPEFKEIIYISCNPIALAKDLKILTKHYDIEEVIPYDMFPNTKSVETLVKLKLKGV